MLLPQRDHDAVIGGRRLQFEIEGTAEALAQRQSPRAIDARTEGRVDDQLHAAALIEEAFGDHAAYRWAVAPSASRRPARRRRPARAPHAIKPAFSADHARRARSLRAVPRLRAKARACGRELRRARREWSARRHGHLPPARVPAPRGVMRHEVVPSRKTSPAMLSTAKSSSSEPTVMPSGSATTRYCAVSGIAPPEVIAVDARRGVRAGMVDGIAMQIRAGASASRGDAFGQHLDHWSKSRAFQRAIRPGAPHQVRTIRLRRNLRTRTRPQSAAPECRAELRGSSSRSSSPRRMARTSAAHSSSSSRVVAKSRPFGSAPTQWPARPMRCSATAMERGEPIWHTRSTVPISMPNSSDAVATTARSSPSLRRRSASRRSCARQAAMMRQDGVLAEALGQVMRHAFGEAARVDEDEGGAILANEFGGAVVDLAPHFVGGDGAQLVARDLDGRTPWRADGPR